MAWLKIEQSLPSHSKTLLGAQLMSMDQHRFLGHLVTFWLWALDHAADDGLLPGLACETLGEQAGVMKRQGKAFIETMVEVGLLEQQGQRYTIHNWEKYAGKLNERRATEKQRIANKRRPVGATNGQHPR